MPPDKRCRNLAQVSGAIRRLRNSQRAAASIIAKRERAYQQAAGKGADPDKLATIVDDLIEAQADHWELGKRIEAWGEIRQAFRRRVPPEKCLGAQDAERVYHLELRKAIRASAEERRDEYLKDLETWRRAREVVARLRMLGADFKAMDAFEEILDSNKHNRRLLMGKFPGMPPYKRDPRADSAQDIWQGSYIYEELDRPRVLESEDYEGELKRSIIPALSPAPRLMDYSGPLTPDDEARLEELAGTLRQFLRKGRPDAAQDA